MDWRRYTCLHSVTSMRWYLTRRAVFFFLLGLHLNLNQPPLVVLDCNLFTRRCVIYFIPTPVSIQLLRFRSHVFPRLLLPVYIVYSGSLALLGLQSFTLTRDVSSSIVLWSTDGLFSCSSIPLLFKLHTSVVYSFSAHAGPCSWTGFLGNGLLLL